MSDRILAEGIAESMRATTPETRQRNAPARYSIAVTLAWCLVAAVALTALALENA